MRVAFYKFVIVIRMFTFFLLPIQAEVKSVYLLYTVEFRLSELIADSSFSDYKNLYSWV
jgi:hypothetical protein